MEKIQFYKFHKIMTMKGTPEPITETDSVISQEERDQWEQYWTMDSAATEEFLGPEKKAQSELIEIRRIVDHLDKERCITQFGHVFSEDNPADCGT
ncbi:hypothetical protein COOONC_07064 [Cooperia oncophora]